MAIAIAIGLGQPSWTLVRFADFLSVTVDVSAVAVPANRLGRLNRARAVRSDGPGAVLGHQTLGVRLLTGLGSETETKPREAAPR